MTDNRHIWVIIMAGGLGSRFWPISSIDNPKQFIDVVGVGRSMLQLTFEVWLICAERRAFTA